jgi:hypothetical protein
LAGRWQMLSEDEARLPPHPSHLQPLAILVRETNEP